MNKARLADELAERLGLQRKQAEESIEVITALITETLKSGDEVTIAGFGTFMPKYRSARMGVNPQKPSERIQIPAVIIPKFKAGKALKDALKSVPAESMEKTDEPPAQAPGSPVIQ